MAGLKITKGRVLSHSTKAQPVNALKDKGLNNDHEFFKDSVTSDDQGMTKYSVDAEESLEKK